MRIRRLHYLIICITCSLTFSLSVQADTVFQSKSFNNFGSLGASLGSTVFDPFDTSLGSLDSVNISFTGFLQVSGTFLPNLIPNGTGGLIPSPYAYNITVQQNLHGLFGFNNFGFATPAQFTYIGTSIGIGEGFVYNTPINYSLTFNETTDLAGFTVPSGLVATYPPGYVTGLREDFYDNLLNSSTGLMMENLLVTSTTALLPVIPNVLMNNTVFLTYNYTPVDDPVDVPVPEPGPLLLLGSGLLILFSMRRKIA